MSENPEKHINDENAPVLEPMNIDNAVDRLKTFTKCPIIPISVKDEMAALGFYYMERHNVIKCSNCSDFVSDICSREYLNHKCFNMIAPTTHSDNVIFTQHKPSKKSPSDFIGAHSDNVIFTQHKPSKKSSSDFIGRQKSKWPYYSDYNHRMFAFRYWRNYAQKPEDLSAAGLFYIGFEDRVICFHCGVGFHNWESRDEPWVEHARFSPKCNFVLQLKGKEFVQKAIEKTTNHIPNEITADTQELLQDLAAGPGNNRCGSTTSVNNNATEQSSMDLHFLCKICYVKESDNLFSPCNHLCSCCDCAMDLNFCIICRSFIEKSTKIYRC